MATVQPGSRSLKSWQAYAVAVVTTAATLGLRLLLEGRLQGHPTLVIFVVPIVISAYFGGLRGGLAATGLSYLAASYFLLPPIYSFSVHEGATAVIDALTASWR